MTAAEFRRMALSFRETAESAHMDHPDFRVGGKIFATLGYPRTGWAMVKLMPDQQQDFVRAEPKAFVAVTGKWGQRGATNVILKAAKKGRVREALAAAWRNTAPKPMVAELDGGDAKTSRRRG
ncbi:MAG: MmcQ/YjbR family DNA-binding protein [Candidatus Acidiferrales bacterium]